jgi:hypothetical protein
MIGKVINPWLWLALEKCRVRCSAGTLLLSAVSPGKLWGNNALLDCIKKKLHGLSPRVNYTDRVIATIHTKQVKIYIFFCVHIFMAGLESREYDSGDPLRWPRDAIYQQKLALTSPTSGCRSVGIDRSRTKATEFVIFLGAHVAALFRRYATSRIFTGSNLHEIIGLFNWPNISSRNTALGFSQLLTEISTSNIPRE